MSFLAGKLAALSEFTEANVEQAFTSTLEEHGLKMGELAQPVRVALTGSTVSPGIHAVIAVLGKDRSVARLKQAGERAKA
jgi:glutamyl-tRNA synthetase